MRPHFRSQIRADNFRIFLHVCWQTFGNFFTEIQHRDFIGNGKHHIHVMLNQQDRNTVRFNFQNDLIELYNLLNLLKRGHLGTINEFRSNFLNRGNKRYPLNPRDLKKIGAKGLSDVSVIVIPYDIVSFCRKLQCKSCY